MTGDLLHLGDLRVLRRTTPGSQAACAMLFVGAGSWYDPPDRSGVAHLYEHAFFAGAGARPDASAVAEAIADLGCRFNGHTHREYSYFYLSGPCTTAGPALDVLLDGYLRPLWAEAELAKQRTAMLGELRLAVGSHQRRLRDLTARALYGDGPAGRSPLGDPDHIAEMGAADLRRHAEGAAVADRATVVLDGPPEAWAGLDRLAAHAVPGGSPRRTPDVRYCPPRGVHLPTPAEAALLALVVPGVSYRLDRREMYALRLLHNVLGANASGRLHRALRDELGMSYQVRSSLEPHQDTGAFLVILGCAPDQAGAAVTAAYRILADALEGPVTPAELARAREVGRGTQVHEAQTAVDRCFVAAYDHFRRGDVASQEELFDLWAQITPTEVTEVARRHLRLQDLRCVLVGPDSARARIADTELIGDWAHA